jgi:hypothetical protein
VVSMGSQFPLGAGGLDALTGLLDQRDHDEALKKLSEKIEEQIKTKDPSKMQALLMLLRMLSPEDLLMLLAMMKPEIFQSLMDAMGQTGFNAKGQQNAGGATPQDSFRAPAAPRAQPVSSGGGSSGGSSGGGGTTGHTSGDGHVHGSSSPGTGGANPSGTTTAPSGPVPDLGNVVPGQDGVPSGLRPNAARGAAVARKVFNFDGTIGGVGSRPGPSDHPSGNAIDLMTNSNTQLGNSMKDYYVQHAQELGVKYVIFQQRIYSPSNGWRGAPMEDRGSPTANHMDHVHISFN